MPPGASMTLYLSALDRISLAGNDLPRPLHEKFLDRKLILQISGSVSRAPRPPGWMGRAFTKIDRSRAADALINSAADLISGLQRRFCPLRLCARICARMIPVLPFPLTQNKIAEFEQFTKVNRPRFDRLRKVVKSPKPQF